MSTFPHRTKRPGRAKKNLGDRIFSHRGPSAGELVSRVCARCESTSGTTGTVPVQAGPQGPQLLTERRGGRRVTRQGRSAAENVRSALTRRPPRSYPPRVEYADRAQPDLHALPESALRRVSVHGPMLANGGDPSRTADGDGRLSPFQNGRISRERPGAAGVTEEHLSGQQTAGLLGSLPASLLPHSLTPRVVRGRVRGQWNQPVGERRM